METLTKIGEFFFEDGHVTEEERIAACERYREKVRKSALKKNPVKNEPQATKGDSVKPRSTEPASSRRGKSTTTRTTRTSADLVSTSESASSGPAEDSSSEDLESMVPETVCADLSVQSVPHNSDVSESATESATDSGSAVGNPGRSLKSQSAKSAKSAMKKSSVAASRSASGSASRAKSHRTAESKSAKSRKKSISAASVSRSRSRVSVDSGRNGSVRSRESRNEMSLGSSGQLPRDNRIPFPMKKTHTPSLYSRFMGSAFKLGDRSASTGTATKTEAGTITVTHSTHSETDTAYDFDESVDHRMVDRLMAYIGEDDESEETTSFRDSHTQESSLNQSQTTSKDDRSHVPSQNTSKYDGSRSRGGTSGTSVSITDSNSYHKQTNKSASAEPELAVAVADAASQEIFEVGLGQASSGAVTSDENWKLFTTKPTSRTVRGWIQENDDNDEGDGGGVEVALTPSSDSKKESPRREEQERKFDYWKAKVRSLSPSRSPLSRREDQSDHGFSWKGMILKPVSPTRSQHSKSRAAELSAIKTLNSKTSGETIGTRQRSIQSSVHSQSGKMPLPLQLPSDTAGPIATPFLPPINSVGTKSGEALSHKSGGQSDEGVDVQAVPLFAPSSFSSRTRSLPVRTSGIYSPSLTMQQILPTDKLLTKNLILDRTSVSKSTVAGRMKTSSAASNAGTDAESGPMEMARATSQISGRTGSRSIKSQNSKSQSSKSRLRNSKSQRSCTDTFDQSKRTQQGPSSRSGLVVTTCTNGSADLLVQNSTMESGTTENMQEYIEVTYESMGASPAASSLGPQQDATRVDSPSQLDEGDEYTPREDDQNVIEDDVPRLPPTDWLTPRRLKRFFGSRLSRKKKDKAGTNEGTTNEEENHSQDEPENDIAAALARFRSGNHYPQSEPEPPAKQSLTDEGFMMAIQRLQMENKDDVASGADDQEVEFEENHPDHQVAEIQSPRKGRLGFFSKLQRTISSPVHKNKGQKRLSIGSNEAELQHSNEEEQNQDFNPRPFSRPKSWVRSFSLPRKKRGAAKFAQPNTDTEAFSHHNQDTREVYILTREHRLPSNPPLPQGLDGQAGEASTNTLHVQERNHTTAIVHSNPWQMKMAHPKYGEHQGAQGVSGPVDEDDEKQYDHTRPYVEPQGLEELKAALRRKIIEKRIAHANAVRKIPIETPQTNDDIPSPPKSKKGLSKLKSGVKGMLRWNGKSQKQGDDGTGSLASHGVDMGGDEDTAIHEEVYRSLVSHGRPDPTFLLQHQMMMHSRNPDCNQTVRTRVVQQDNGSTRGNPKHSHLSHPHPSGVGTKKSQLQRVLGKREQKKTKHTDSTTNSIIDPRVPDPVIELEDHLRLILRSLSSSSSVSYGDGEHSYDGTQNYTCDDTVDDTQDGDATYNVRNQRVLETLRLLHAVKKSRKKTKKQELALARRRMPDCQNGFIDPIIDEIEHAACGVKF